jgi:para-nitrobenzyl esterase
MGTPEDVSSDAAPIVTIGEGAVRGAITGGGHCFLGLPFAAPPTGDLRWRPPRPPAGWQGVRDATRFGPSSPQPANPALSGPTSEDCLYLNVYTPALGGDEGGLPVLVWIHGGRFTLGAGRDYDGTKLAALGIVVVTVNHRLGALGFLAHPALASRPGGASGNYGLMDQASGYRPSPMSSTTTTRRCATRRR